MINEEQLIENETPTSFLTAKRMVLVEVLVFSIVMTMLQIAFMRNAYILNLITVLTSLGYGVGILAWCRADSRLRNYQPGQKFPYAVVIFGSLALVYYFFRSRGFAKGIVSVGYFGLFIIGMYLVSAIAGIIVLIAMLPFYNPVAPPGPAAAPPPAYRSVPPPPASK